MPDSFWWAAFLGFVSVLLVLDLGVFHRKAHAVGVREALTWSAVWITLALIFNAGIYFGWIGGYSPELRERAAFEFLTGYLVEKSLSVDNVFVFALIFTLLSYSCEVSAPDPVLGNYRCAHHARDSDLRGHCINPTIHAIIYVFRSHRDLQRDQNVEFRNSQG
jgi:hypothetical protein